MLAQSGDQEPIATIDRREGVRSCKNKSPLIAVVGAGLMQSYDKTFVAKENSECAENQSIQAEYRAQIKVYNIELIDRGMAARVDKGWKPIVDAPVPW